MSKPQPTIQDVLDVMGDFNKILGQVATDVVTLKSDVRTLKSDVATLKTTVSDIADRQNSMETKLDKLAETVTISQKTNDRRFHRIEDHLNLPTFVS